jgi:hypothetical protein
MVTIFPVVGTPPPKVYVTCADADRPVAKEICQQLQDAGYPVWSRMTHASGPAEGSDSAIKRAKIVVMLATPEARTASLVLFDLRKAASLGKPIIALAIGQDGLKAASQLNTPARLVDATKGLTEETRTQLQTIVDDLLQPNRRRWLQSQWQKLKARIKPAPEPFTFEDEEDSALPPGGSRVASKPGWMPPPLMLVAFGGLLFLFTASWMLRPAADAGGAPGPGVDIPSIRPSPAAAPPKAAAPNALDQRAAKMAAMLSLRLIEVGEPTFNDGLKMLPVRAIVANQSSEMVSVPTVLLRKVDADGRELFRKELTVTRPILGPGELLEISDEVSGVPEADGILVADFEVLLQRR